MKLSVTTKGDFRKTKNLLKNTKFNYSSIGSDGVNILSKNTPTDTGETKSSWKYTQSNKDRITIEWYNDAHPESKVNVAKLINIDHFNKQGVFIHGTKYLQKSMDEIYSKHKNKIVSDK